MRHHEIGPVDDGVAIQDQIEVEGSGSAGVGSLAPARCFDGHQQCEELSSRQVGGRNGGGIQEGRAWSIDRRRLMEAGSTKLGQALAEGGQRKLEVPLAVAQIRTQSDRADDAIQSTW